MDRRETVYTLVVLKVAKNQSKWLHQPLQEIYVVKCWIKGEGPMMSYQATIKRSPISTFFKVHPIKLTLRKESKTFIWLLATDILSRNNIAAMPVHFKEIKWAPQWQLPYINAYHMSTMTNSECLWIIMY